MSTDKRPTPHANAALTNILAVIKQYHAGHIYTSDVEGFIYGYLEDLRLVEQRLAEMTERVEMKWFSVNDKIPEGEEVICWDGEYVSTYFPTTGEPPNRGIERCNYLGITHWMPMPIPPLSATPRPQGKKE